MSGNRHAVNRAAVNESGRLILSGAAVFAASCAFAGDITYYWKVNSSIQPLSVLESSSSQTHQVFTSQVGEGYVSEAGYVQKWVTSNSSTSSEFTSVILPTGATALFAATAQIDYEITYKFRAASALNSVGTLGFDESLVTYNLYPTATFELGTASISNDYKVKLNGETTYDHYASYGAEATAEINIGQIITTIENVDVIGTGSISIPITYKFRAGSSGSAKATVQASGGYTLAGSCSALTSSLFIGTGYKNANATRTFSCTALFINPTAKQFHKPVVKTNATAVATSSPVQIHFAGYNYVDAVAELESAYVVSRRVEASPSAEAIIKAYPFTWHWFFEELNIEPQSSVYANADIKGFDAVVFNRPADTKYFVRSPDLKNFTRPKI